MARKPNYESQLEEIDAQIEKLSSQISTLKNKRNDITLKKDEADLKILRDAIKQSGQTISAFIAQM